MSFPLLHRLCLLLLSCALHAETWKVAADHAFPPYSYVEASTQQPAGLDVDIVKAVLEQIKQPYELKLYPWERVKALLDAKQIDMAFQFVGTPERRERYRLVGPIRQGMTVFVSRMDSNIQYDTLHDLAPYTIGTVHGFAYTAEFDQASFLKKDAGALNPAQLLPKLMAGRVDVVVGDHDQLMDLIRRGGLRERVRVLEKPLAVVDRFVGFRKDAEQEATRFAQGLEALRREGELQRILERWR